MTDNDNTKARNGGEDDMNKLRRNYELMLPDHAVRTLCDQWIQEDCSSYDVGALIAGDSIVTATLYAKSSPVLLCGLPFFRAVFTAIDPSIHIDLHYSEGYLIEGASSQSKVTLGHIKGRAYKVLQAERIALNVLAECCSISTASYQATRQRRHGVTIAATRKTTPGLRLVQKYACMVGGVDTHRYDLSSMVMLKDNHLQLSRNDIAQALRKVKATASFSLKVDVECDCLEQALQACEAGADIVMLDNFNVPELTHAAKIVKQKFPNVLVEASGGINFSTLSQYCVEDVDIVSFSINKYAQPVDLSLKIDPL